MAVKLCFCIPPKIGYNILGVLCCINVIVGLILLFSDQLIGWAVTVCFGIPSAFWLNSQIKPAIVHKKLFAYTFVVLTIILATAGAILIGFVTSLLVDQGQEWIVYVFPIGLWLVSVAISVYLYLCIQTFVKEEEDKLENTQRLLYRQNGESLI